MGHGTCILPEQRLVLGRGHVSEIAASITATQVDHLKDMQISENEDTDLTARVSIVSCKFLLVLPACPVVSFP